MQGVLESSHSIHEGTGTVTQVQPWGLMQEKQTSKGLENYKGNKKHEWPDLHQMYEEQGHQDKQPVYTTEPFWNGLPVWMAPDAHLHCQKQIGPWSSFHE